mmetsp:Transcript_10038/g.22863  ORF Transcript_10038/g.22863 Transcript_10038/m.22863 type:complete len:102 (-) Transcript_10038:37-342(-)
MQAAAAVQMLKTTTAMFSGSLMARKTPKDTPMTVASGVRISTQSMQEQHAEQHPPLEAILEARRTIRGRARWDHSWRHRAAPVRGARGNWRARRSNPPAVA